ncbi:hypothetical protein LTR86_000455 [Recurvomyces mirabilis]|nr:hypothetical protein LTR86_000455 [Recurvomyces mirabilis]
MASIALSLVERPPFSLTISVNSVLPLTTAFTPAPVCSSSVWESVDSTQGTITCTPSLAPTLTSQCYPRNFNETYTILYSPGVCPQGYAAAASWTSAGSDVHTSLCCPHGMSWLQVVSSCSEILPTGSATAIVASNTTTTMTEPFTAYAPAIAVAWASSDLTLFSPASLPLLTTASLTSEATSAAATSSDISAGSVIASSTATTATGASQTSTTPGPGLSVGAKAGIGVGATVGGLLCLAVAAWFLLWRRRSFSTKGLPEAEGKAELPGDGIEKKALHISELGPNGEIYESAAKERPPEMGDNVRYELEADWHGHEAPTTRAPNVH